MSGNGKQIKLFLVDWTLTGRHKDDEAIEEMAVGRPKGM